MRLHWLVMGVVLTAPFGCANSDSANIVSSPYASGQRHSEPVFFNGRHYDVSFTFDAGKNLYDVVVAGDGGRALGGGPGDRDVVEQIGGSTIRHFACANGQKSQIVSGSARHTGTAWSLQAKCI